MLWTALATAPTVLGTFEIKALIIRSGRFRPSTIAISGTVSGACGHHSPQPLVVPYPDGPPDKDAHPTLKHMSGHSAGLA
jgi:hypothetical protein